MSARPTLGMLRQELAGQEVWEPGGSWESGLLHTTLGRGFPVTSHSIITSSPSVTSTSPTVSTLGDTEREKLEFFYSNHQPSSQQDP